MRNDIPEIGLEKNMDEDFLMEQLLLSTEKQFSGLPPVKWGYDLNMILAMGDNLDPKYIELDILHQKIHELGHLEKNQPMQKWKHLLKNYVEED